MKKVFLVFICTLLFCTSWSLSCAPKYSKPIIGQLWGDIEFMKSVKEANYVFTAFKDEDRNMYQIDEVYDGDVRVQEFAPLTEDPRRNYGGTHFELEGIWIVADWQDQSLEPYRIRKSWCYWMLNVKNGFMHYYVAKFVPTAMLAGILIYIIGTPWTWIFLTTIFLFIWIIGVKMRRKEMQWKR